MAKRETLTTWHNLIAWNKKAEVMAKIFSQRPGASMSKANSTNREYRARTMSRKQATEIVISDFKKWNGMIRAKSVPASSSSSQRSEPESAELQL
jgi:single-stranded DNA-binding protein